jgi:Protein of unknown function (DUF3891)
MLRSESETGWWLIRHPDHAKLAGDFGAAWGNGIFRRPEPHERVLLAIAQHDDGWIARDASPDITRQGKPSAFSVELVGKYSAFEEIDLADYLAVRDRAVRIISEKDPYAGLLVAMHTYNLLTAHADRTTIAPAGLILLDAFLERQRLYHLELREAIRVDASLAAEDKSDQRISEHFRLLQACDNLSLLACVAYAAPAHLLHPLPLRDGTTSEVMVEPMGPRHFRLGPWPFAEAELRFEFPARHVCGKQFGSARDLQDAYAAAKDEYMPVLLSR